ncbi:MAG: hypothetical protein LBE91_08185 [Tannerella sp.]|jgi:hypothetical protein|nr:hypothetical protein [Tannerella sp.]
MEEEKNKTATVTGYKGFNSKLQCIPNGEVFQFKIGNEYEEETANLCNSGFHFCENPLDIFYYYPPSDSRYCQIEASDVSEQRESDTKRCCKKIKIAAEINLHGLISAGVKFILEKINWKDSAVTNTGYQSAATNTGNYSAATNTGNYSAATNTGYQSAATNTGYQSAAMNTGYQSAATNTGYQSAATNTGDQSAATNTGNYSAATNTGYQSVATNTGNYSAAMNTGYQSAATNTGDQSAATNTGNYSVAMNTGYQSAATVKGENSVAISTGYMGMAKAPKGSAIVLVERDNNGKLLSIKSAIIDGKKLKENTFYQLENEKFKEVV